MSWTYTVNRLVRVNEQFGWIPHCAVYRERNRVGASSYVPTSYGLNASVGSGSFPLDQRTEYLLDRSNGDRRFNADTGGNFTHFVRRINTNARVKEYGDFQGVKFRSPVGFTAWANTRDGVALTDYGNLPPSWSDAALNTLGATLVNRALPTLPAVNIGVDLGEMLHDGFPRASLNTLKSLRGAPRGAADDFLNYEFGWKPLVSDMRDLVGVLRDKNAILQQLARDSGRVVRRRIQLPPVITTDAFPVTGSAPRLYGNSGAVGTANFIKTGPGAMCSVSKREDTWFSGAFQYHLPLGSDTLSKWNRYNIDANRLFGLSLTPDLLWNLAPWSWLVDWVSNTGDVISNFSTMAQYGMVMRYGYVCKRVEYRYTFTGTSVPSGTVLDLNPGASSAFQVEYVNVVEYRRKANPFGFGITWESLTKTQLAILAALGMTRSNRSG